MSRATELADALDAGDFSLRDIMEAAALLRQQDAVIKQCVEALENSAVKHPSQIAVRDDALKAAKELT